MHANRTSVEETEVLFFVEKNSTNKKIKKAHSICIRNLITKKETDQYEKN